MVPGNIKGGIGAEVFQNPHTSLPYNWYNCNFYKLIFKIKMDSKTIVCFKSTILKMLIYPFCTSEAM